MDNNFYNSLIFSIYSFFNKKIKSELFTEYSDDKILYILLFILNNILLLNNLINNILNVLNKHRIDNVKYINKICNIENTLNDMNNNIYSVYKLYTNHYTNHHTKKLNQININIYKDLNYSINKDKLNNSNLDLYTIDNINDYIFDNVLTNDLDNLYNNPNYINIKKVDIGFNNYYELHSFKYFNDSKLPLNLLIYIQELNQVVIKIGSKTNYKFINSRISKVYNIRDDITKTIIKNKSILCNNNINSLNKKCNNNNCKYYHDYILGYSDNYDIVRQFSNNPLVYNCPDFKDGSRIYKNKKKINWYEAINLYQSSLSNILIGCIHANDEN